MPAAISEKKRPGLGRCAPRLRPFLRHGGGAARLRLRRRHGFWVTSLGRRWTSPARAGDIKDRRSWPDLSTALSAML